MTNPYGDLSIKVPSGAWLPPKVEQPKSLYVTVTFDQAISNPGSVKSENCDDMQFRMSKDITCTAAVTRGMNALVNIMQWSLIGSDKSLGSLKIPLDPLETGQSIGPQDYEVK